MRISDWSSDVCSSDLRRRWARGGERGAVAVIRVMMGAVVASAHSFAAAAAPAALVVLALLGTSQAQARERILSYDTVIEVHADGSLDIVEDIRVRAEGRAIRRGIYRDFPTRYRDRIGNRVVVGFEVVGVQRDGKPEPWFTENVDNGVRINTGNDDFLQVPAEYTYTLHYTTDRQVGFFDDHDELYFNAIGIGWNFAIERGSVEVRLPQPVPVADLTAEAYTGGHGSGSQDFHASVPAPGTARWTLTRPLAPGEGMTVALSFPKGVVAEPTPAENARWLLKDNSAVLIAMCGLAGLLVYVFLPVPKWGRAHPRGEGAVAAEGQQRRPDRAVRPGGAAGVLLPALAPGGARPAPRRHGGALRPAGRLFAGRPALRQAHAVRQPLLLVGPAAQRGRRPAAHPSRQAPALGRLAPDIAGHAARRSQGGPSRSARQTVRRRPGARTRQLQRHHHRRRATAAREAAEDRKSTRLNSSH